MNCLTRIYRHIGLKTNLCFTLILILHYVSFSLGRSFCKNDKGHNIPAPDLNCHVRNWDHMNCTWSLTAAPIYRLEWSFYDPVRRISLPLPGCDSSTPMCRCSSENMLKQHLSCLFTKQNLTFPSEEYYLRLVPKSWSRIRANSSCQNVMKISTADFVEPDPVKALSVVNRTSQSLDVTWKATINLLPIDVHYKARVIYAPISRSSNSRTVYTLEERVTLTDLNPYTIYNITVDGIFLKFAKETGFWSESRTILGSTLEDVPSRAPLIISGGFSQSYIGNHSRTVRLYWQSVEEEFSNGIITDNRIRYCIFNQSEPACNWTELVSSAPHSAVIILSTEQDYEVKIESGTSVGFNESLQINSIIIPKNMSDRRIINSKDIVVLTNDSRVTVQWPSEPLFSSYTVFWCPTRLTGEFYCTSPLNWSSLLVNQSVHSGKFLSYTLDAAVAASNYSVGISAEWAGPNGSVLSDGINWSRCNQDVNKEVPVPTSVETLVIKDSIFVAWSPPDCDESSCITAYSIQCSPIRSSNHEVIEVNVSARDASSCKTSQKYQHTIQKDLIHKVEYRVQMRSLSYYGASDWSVEVRVEYFSDSSSKQDLTILLSAFGAVVLVALFIIGIFIIRQVRKKINISVPSQLNIPVVVSSGYSSNSSSRPTDEPSNGLYRKVAHFLVTHSSKSISRSCSKSSANTECRTNSSYTTDEEMDLSPVGLLKRGEVNVNSSSGYAPTVMTEGFF